MVYTDLLWSINFDGAITELLSEIKSCFSSFKEKTIEFCIFCPINIDSRNTLIINKWLFNVWMLPYFCISNILSGMKLSKKQYKTNHFLISTSLFHLTFINKYKTFCLVFRMLTFFIEISRNICSFLSKLALWNSKLFRGIASIN